MGNYLKIIFSFKFSTNFEVKDKQVSEIFIDEKACNNTSTMAVQYKMLLIYILELNIVGKIEKGSFQS